MFDIYCICYMPYLINVYYYARFRKIVNMLTIIIAWRMVYIYA